MSLNYDDSFLDGSFLTNGSNFHHKHQNEASKVKRDITNKFRNPIKLLIIFPQGNSQARKSVIEKSIKSFL
jgi:hypothetical protein